MEIMPANKIPKWTQILLNNLYEVERKLALHSDPGNASRNIEKIKHALSEEGLFFEDPMGHPFKETRTDLEATITGVGTENLVVVEVMKPIIRSGNKERSYVVQKGIVLVQSKNEGDEK